MTRVITLLLEPPEHSQTKYKKCLVSNSDISLFFMYMASPLQFCTFFVPYLFLTGIVKLHVNVDPGGVFSKTEMSEVLTEICKMDPNFDKELFIRDCRDDIIPNVLEAIIRGDLEILEDWCHEAVSRIFETWEMQELV